MKPFSSLGLFCAAALIAGCASSTAKGVGGRELTIVRPASQTLHRGETNRVAIVVRRENLPSNVTIRFEQLPKGVSVVEADRKVAPGELGVDYTLVAANDADLVTNYQARVTAEAPDGLSASETLTLTVKQ